MTSKIPALSKGVHTTESANGRGYIKIAFGSLAELHAADDELRALLAANPQCWPCWSCRAPVTMANRADADGNCPHCEVELDLEDWPAAPVVERQDNQQMARMPVERCYDVRAKMIIAFNESRKAGGDLDDGLDAAYKAALRYSPASLPAPVAVASREESICWLKRIDGIGQNRAELIYSMGFRRHTEVPQS